MKKILTAILIAILALAVATPVLAADDKGVEPKIGTKVVLDKHTEAVYQGKDAKGEHIYTATIYSLPKYLDDLKTEIDTSWHYDSKHNEWVAGTNLFEATVDAFGTKVTITKDNESMTLDPSIKIDNKVVKPISKVPQLVNDYYNPNYSCNTLQWDYGIFKRQIRLIEGCIMQYLTFESNPHGDVNIDSPTKSSKFIWDRPVEAWDYNSQPVAVSGNLVYAAEFDREDITYPIVIDPAPTFTTSSSDGYLGRYSDSSWTSARESSSSNTSSFTATGLHVTGYESATGRHYIYRSIVFFDTSSLPDSATITDTALYLYVSNIEDADDAEIWIVSGMPTYPHDPPVLADYDWDNYGNFASTYGYADASDDLTLDQYNKVNTNDSALLKAIVNKTGDTKLCLVSRHDKENDNPALSDYSLVSSYSYEQGVGYQPYLEVTYTASAPTITTDAASAIGYTTARLNSTVVDDGGEACEVRWGYGKTSEAAITDYDDYTAYAGAYTTGQHPYLDVGSLDSNTTYYFRVEAQNGGGTDLGGELNFDTLNAVADVTDLRAIPHSGSVSLNWTKPSGATNTMVRFAYDDFPPTEADGTEVYFDTGNNTTHTSLTAGTTYYYSAWGESGGTYSTNPAEVAITTLPVGAASEDIPEAAMPTGWYQAPDYTNLSNLGIFYIAGNGLADDIGMPRATAWVTLMIILAAGVAFLLYWRTHNIFATIGGASVVMVIGYFQEIVPLWIMIITIVIGVGVMVSRRATA